jgi:hypothetical protein
MKRKRIGRPPIPKRLHKASLLSVRFSVDERRSLEKAAEDRGQKLSEWARTILLGAIQTDAVEIHGAVSPPATS